MADITCSRCGRLNPPTADRCNYCMMKFFPSSPYLSSSPTKCISSKKGNPFSKFCTSIVNKFSKIHFSSPNYEDIYNWANLIINPVGLIALWIGFIPQTYSWVYVLWIIISSLLNHNLRSAFSRFVAAVIGQSILLSCAGAVVGILVLIVVATLMGTIGLIFAMVYLWISALIYVIRNS